MHVEEPWSTMKRILLGAIENLSSVYWKRKLKTLPYIIKKIKKARNRKKKYWKLYIKNCNQVDYYPLPPKRASDHIATGCSSRLSTL